MPKKSKKETIPQMVERKKKPRQPSKRALVKKLDAVFSVWIRLRGSEKFTLRRNLEGRIYVSGDVPSNVCYTCNRWQDVKDLQCGHFMSRRFYSTRWEPDNCRPQCRSCNLYNQGEQFEFGKRLEQELGINRVEELRQLRHTLSKFSTCDYEQMIDDFNERIREQQERLG